MTTPERPEARELAVDKARSADFSVDPNAVRSCPAQGTGAPADLRATAEAAPLGPWTSSSAGAVFGADGVLLAQAYGGTWQRREAIAAYIVALSDRLAVVEAELAEETARLDWYASNPTRVGWGAGMLHSPGSWTYTDAEHVVHMASSLRDAIDAARRAPLAGGEERQQEQKL